MSVRRKILGLLTAGAVAMSAVSCTSTQIQQAQQQIETFIGQVQAATAVACKFVPTVDTIISMVNSGIGQVVGVVTAAICNAIPPPVSGAYKALPRLGAGNAPAAAGQASNGVVINGWRTK